MKKLLLPSALLLSAALLHAEETSASSTNGAVIISGSSAASGATLVKIDDGGVLPVPGEVHTIEVDSTGRLVEDGRVIRTGRIAAPTPASGYELRGFIGLGERAEVSIRTPGSTESKWYKVGKKSGGILVEKADSKAGTATILVDGRKVNLRLAGEEKAGPAVGTLEAVDLSPEDAARAAARKARRERFNAMRENSTPEQQAEFRRVMREKFEEMRKNNPDGMNPENFNDPEKRKRMGETFRANMRAAAEAAAKLPGKDGKITPVPEDFDKLLVEEGKEMEPHVGRFRFRRGEGAGAPSAVQLPAVPQTPAPAVPQAPAPEPEGK